MAYTPNTGNTVTRGFTEQYLSMYSAELEPQVLPQLYQKHGKGIGIFDWLQMAGQVLSLKGEDMTAYEEGAQVRPIRINASGITAQTSAGDDVTFRLHAGEYDTDNNTYLRVGDTIIIPAKFMSGQKKPGELLITAVGATSGADCTGKCLDEDMQITSTVTANSYLQVNATRYARGTGQPSARSRGLYSRTFTTGISKETVHLEGGVQFQETKRAKMKNGGEGVLSRATIEAEFSLNNQLNGVLLISDENTNSLTQTSHASKSNSVRSTVGLWNHLDSLGQKLYYSVKISIPDLYTAKELLRSQGVVDTEVLFAFGDKLSRGVETLGLEYLKEYSGGSNLLDGMGAIGVRPKKLTVGNIDFIFKEFAGFSNPNTFGTDADYWGNAGMIIPSTQVTVKSSDINIAGIEGGKVVIPNVSIGYPNNYGENRERILKTVAGVNGLDLPASHEYDDVNWYWLTEYMLIAMQVNQMIRVLKEGTY